LKYKKGGKYMGTIIGRQYSPEDNNGKRDVIHPETQIDAVLDPVTGIPLRDQLEAITDTLQPVNVNGTDAGLITPEMARLIQSAASNNIVVDTVKPSFTNGGYWYNVYDNSMTTTDAE
jgi:hypothetical protein